MSPELPIQIASIVAQNSAYLACLSWLAWRYERSRGADAFHLVVVYALGAWLLSAFTDKLLPGPLLHVGAVSMLAYLLDIWWGEAQPRAGEGKSLVQVIVFASIALIAFDWVTSHTPISLPGGGDSRHLALLCALVAWVLVLAANKTRAGMMLRLGTSNRWAVEYWDRPLPAASYPIRVARLLCWVPVLTLPLVTTGLLSSTILKDVAIAILIARVAAARGPLIVLAASFTLSILRAAVGFAFLSNAGPPLVEIMVFISMMLWLRYRGSRTEWGEADGR